ncbi:hypothetical protein HB565_001791 [Campylobacter jejuni]|nr:hypothetical protein [Campylobacter jejuni]
MQKYNKQKNIYLQAIEHKKHLEQKILQAQILQEKNKISREKLYKELEEVKVVQENTHISKIEIDSKILNISDLKKSFYQNPSYDVGGKIKCRKRKIKCRIFATNYLSFNLKLKL